MGSRVVKPRRRKGNLADLNSKQLLFANEWLVDHDTKAAAKRAGFTGKNTGYKLLGIPAVAATIGTLLTERLNECKLDRVAVLNHLHTALFLDPLELFEKDGDCWRIKDLASVPAHVRKCISKLKHRNYYNKDGEITNSYFEVELMSKDAALTLAAQHLGIIGKAGIIANVNVDANLLTTLLQRVENPTVVDGKFIEDKSRGKS